MRKQIKAIALTGLMTMFLLLGTGKVYAITQSEVQSKLDSLTSQYVETCWTKNGKPSSSTSDSNYWYGWQCKGFANWIFYQLFGVENIGPYVEGGVNYYLASVNGATELGRLSPNSMSVESAKNLLLQGAPGDYIQMRRRESKKAHSMILYSVNNAGIKVFDCNSDNRCTVKLYDISWQDFYKKNDSMSLYRANGYTPSVSHNPQGVLEVINAGTNTIYIEGWAIDLDDPTAVVDLHVYIGDTSANPDVHLIRADQRRDIVAMYYPEAGANHGFSATIKTTKTGTQPVEVNMINIGGGSNASLGGTTVSIGRDQEAPVVEKTWIDSTDANGYTVKARFTDNIGIEHISCATWTLTDGQDDLKWQDMKVSGNEASTYVKYSDHGDGMKTYRNHVYAYDYGNNQGIGEVDFERTDDLGQEFYAHVRSDLLGTYLTNFVYTDTSAPGMGGVGKDANNLWKFVRQTDGSYKIFSCQDGKVLHVVAGSADIGTRIIMEPAYDTWAQNWYLGKNGTGYSLLPQCAPSRGMTTDLVLDILMSENKAQIYHIEKVSDTSSYEPQLSDLTFYGDENCTKEKKFFEAGESLYIKPIYKNIPYYHLLISKDGTVITDEDITGSGKVIAVNELEEGCYTIKLTASNSLKEIVREADLTVGKKEVITPEPSEEEGLIKVENVSGVPGETVQVPILLEKNPGVIVAQYKLGYDRTKVKLVKVEDKGLLKTSFMSDNYEMNPYILSWGDGLLEENITETGVIAVAYFEIQDTVEEGSIEITVTYDQAYNSELKEAVFTSQNGKIEIVSYLPGDVDGDRSVKLNDAILLRRYIAGTGSNIDLYAADVSRDGEVRLDDAILLRRYIAGWNVNIG